MAVNLIGARAPVRPSLYLVQPKRSPLAWIKRRARRLQTGFSVSRRIALAQAVNDWSRFQPCAAH